MLGVATNGAMTRCIKLLTKRRQQFARKVQRIRALGEMGISKTALLRATAMPAMAYGSELAGFSDTALRSTRSLLLSAAATATSSGCMDADFMARDGQHGRLDPAFVAHTAPIICFLAKAWWHEWRKPQ